MSSMKPTEERGVMAVADFDAVIFDCFGVLYTDAKQSIMTLAPKDRHKELADIFTSNNYGYLDRSTYVSRVAEVLQMSIEEVNSYMIHEHTLNQPLVTLITEQLKPTYKIGMLSNIGRDWIDDFFSKHQLHSLFDEVVLSGEENLAKPHPAIFTLIAARLGVEPSRCLMIDDIAENCEGAEIAGMSAIHFTSNAQLLDELYAKALIH